MTIDAYIHDAGFDDACVLDASIQAVGHVSMVHVYCVSMIGT